MTNFEKVRNFHLIFQRPSRSKPTLLPRKEFLLRIALIGEEFKEFVEAETVVDAADAIGDLLYVCYGAAVEMGIDADKVFAAVHESNMSKLDPDGKPILRSDGKVMKGESYVPPDIKGALGVSVPDSEPAQILR